VRELAYAGMGASEREGKRERERIRDGISELKF